MSPDDNLILIGFMGAGKTSVGRKLAQRTGRRFCDLDREIERSQGCAISQLFVRVGEAGFRDIESDELGHIEPGRSLVLSCGGGIILRESNRVLLPELGTVVWLHAHSDVLFKRVSRADHRPLLSVENPRAAFDRLLADREPLYRAVARISLDTTHLTHDEVAAELLRQLGCGSDENRTPATGARGGV